MDKKQLEKQIDELLTRGVEKIYPSKEALKKELLSGKKLKLYQGFDPTGIKLHIGHMVGLMKLKQWQDLGHEVIFLIGDGTGQAGDPSGKTRVTEKYLKNKELKENAKDYIVQAGKVVKFSGDNSAKVLYNSEWLNKLNLVDILNIAENFSLQQLEERDLFVKRKKRGEPINMREFLYPFLQAYDSVEMNVDLELGGDDQSFNMLCGRTLMKKMLKKEKYVMTTPLLTDSAGNKIGKSEGNVIALDSKPKELFGMIMNLTDDIIIKGFELLTNVSMDEIELMKQEIGKELNPRDAKARLAFEIVKMLNSESDAQEAQEQFDAVFKEKQSPEKIENIRIEEDELSLIDLVIKSGQIKSNSEARRLIDQGAIKINGAKRVDAFEKIKINESLTMQIGKYRFVKFSRG